MKIMSVVGARPNFMKVSPIVSAIHKYNENIGNKKGLKISQRIDHVLVHTGQHYDKMMSDAFFNDLGIPEPDIFLGVGSGSHAMQTAEIMKRFEGVLLQEKPDVIIVVGDVNSTIACALVASKISYDSNGRQPLIAHVESGLRSFDSTMPEEINRILTDHVSDFLFVTEKSGIENLRNEGIPKEKTFFVGNTMIDTLLIHRKKADESKILDVLGLKELHSVSNGRKITRTTVPFGLLTLHRPSNVDNKEKFVEILEALQELIDHLTIIFPVHPRTQNRIKEMNLAPHFIFLENGKAVGRSRINVVAPLGYIDFLCLMKNARIVLTDSGGIQEETTCLGVPCVTIRGNTERPITLTEGTNVLAGVTKKGIINALRLQLNREITNSSRPNKWDGRAADRIVGVLAKAVASRRK